MSLNGTFSTMALPDLLQWLGNSSKTGTLEVERNKVVKYIVIRDGCVIACSTDEKTELLGNFLLARGRISEEVLRKALAEQEAKRRHLGEILVEMAALTREELGDLLTEKAEETIFSLFDWEEAVFRFKDSVVPTQAIFPVNLRMDDILLRGAHRLDEINRIRMVFPDPGFVLAKTGKEPPDDLMRNRMGRTLFELINGDRSIAEILLHSRSSEYAVYRLLFEMFRAGLVIVREEVRIGQEIELPAEELLFPDETASGEAPAASRIPERTSAAVADLPRPAPPPSPSPSASAAAAVAAAAALGPDAQLTAAQKFLDTGEFDSAMDILDRLYKAHPNHDSLRRLLAEAEAAFVDKAYRHYVPAGKIPRLTRPLEELVTEEISPAESFLLTRMDGTWDVKSIIQVCPLREVEALRALKRMRERGIVEFVEPAS